MLTTVYILAALAGLLNGLSLLVIHQLISRFTELDDRYKRISEKLLDSYREKDKLYTELIMFSSLLQKILPMDDVNEIRKEIGHMADTLDRVTKEESK